MATAYDDLGRPRLMARSPVTGGTVTGALAAFTYANSGTGPGSVTEYRFFVPSTYPDGAIPQTADVQQTTTYIDGLGRPIQRRERLGGTGLGDPSAHITQNLSGYRVSGAIVYDAAGRVRAEIEPFYGASAGYVDYRTAVGQLAPQAAEVAGDCAGRRDPRAPGPLPGALRTGRGTDFY